MAGQTNKLKKLFVSLVAVGALAAPAGWISQAGAQSEPDANGDVHSNCHTGSKFRGAGGEDAGPGNPKDTSDDAACAAAPVIPPAQPVVPGAPSAPVGVAPSAARPGAAPAPVSAPRLPRRRSRASPG